MKYPLLLLAFLLAQSICAQRTFDVTIADSTYHMKQYWLVVYMKGDATTPLDSLSAARMQQEHLAHQDVQAKEGLIVLAGPFGDNGDWRGILLYDADTREEVELKLQQDPFVKAGRLNYEIRPWWGAVGTCLK